MSCHRLYACWLWWHLYRMWPVVKTWEPNFNASCSALLPDTRNYTFLRGKTVSRVMKIYSGLFSVFLFLLPLIISALNSCSALKGAIPLMVAMKLYSAQLRHQNRAMTARPHAARVTHTGSQKESLECFHWSNKCLPHGVNGIKPNSLTNNSSPIPFTQVACLSQWLLHWGTGSHCSSHSFLCILITSVISFLCQFALLTSQQSWFMDLRSPCFTNSTTNLIHSAFRCDQQESVDIAPMWS